MTSLKTPRLFFVVPKGKDFEIQEMTEAEALRRWDKKGLRWLDVGKMTLSEAQQLKDKLRAGRSFTQR
jgi:hypothetical protein